MTLALHILVLRNVEHFKHSACLSDFWLKVEQIYVLIQAQAMFFFFFFFWELE